MKTEDILSPPRFEESMTVAAVFGHDFRWEDYYAEEEVNGQRRQLYVRPGDLADNVMLTAAGEEVQDETPYVKRTHDIISGAVFDGAMVDTQGDPEYVVWDVIRFNGADCFGASLEARRKLLEGLERQFPHWMRLIYRSTDVQGLLGEVIADGRQGIVMKKKGGAWGHGWIRVRPDEIPASERIICTCSSTGSQDCPIHGMPR